jgi:hypothetical protein
MDMLEDADFSVLLVDGMSPEEKMQLAHWPNAKNFDLLEPACVEQQIVDVQMPPRYQEVRSFLLDSSAYQWLIENARSSALLTPRKGTTLDLIAREFDATLLSIKTSRPDQAQIFQTKFWVNWDLQGFLSNQEYDSTLEIAFERAITVTGSGTNAQALSCLDYMCQTWPSSGRQFVRILQTALMSPESSSSGKQTLHTDYS